MADDTNNRLVLDYTARDFESLRSMMVGIAKGKFPEWITVGEAGDFGTLLIEQMAYMGDVLNYYIDRIGSEPFLGTAQLRRSVLYTADQLGYVPIGQQAATVVLRASLAEGEPPFTVPAGTELTSSGSIQATFTTDTDLYLEPGDTDIVVTAVEGVTVTDALLGVAKGVPNAEFVLPDKGVIYRTPQVKTLEGGQFVEWSYLSNIVLARPTQSAFSTYVDDEGFTHVVFGDAAAGRIPPTSVDILCSYRYGVGAAANEISPGEISGLDSTSSISSYIPTGFTISNPDRPLGGADPESVETMRYSIPRANNVQSRAVTTDDFVSLTMQVPGVGKAIAYGQVYSSVNVRIANNSGSKPAEVEVDGYSEMSRLRALVSAQLEDKKLLGTHVFVEDVWQNEGQGWEDVVIVMDVYVQDGFNRSQVVSAVGTALEDLLAFNNVDFGKRISVGQVYRAASSVLGIDYINLREFHGTTVLGGLISTVHTGPKKIPRIRPLVRDGYTVTQESGLSLTGFGGLV